jgi:hypothetical protein
MNSMVYRLLKGYLLRSVWLYAFFAVLQFMMTGVYWWRGYDRVPAAGVLLGIWGAVAALNTHSLVWRSLPLTSRDAGVFRWWAMAGAPGIFLTLLTLISWVSQRFSGLPVPETAAILEGLLATWGVLGVLAMLSRSSQRSGARLRQAKIAGTLIGSSILLVYGLPVGSAVRPYSIVIGCAGVTLLFVSAMRAYRGVDWRWPDLAARKSRTTDKKLNSWLTHRYGLSVVLIPLAQRTVILAAVATVIIVSLQRTFPQASVALFWVYFIGLSTTGFLLTYQVRVAFQPLRCLPLSVKQLAGFLMLFGSLPGLATLLLTLLINRAVLNAALIDGQVATFALVIISLQALPPRSTTLPGRSKIFNYWVPLIQRIYVPAYLGAIAAYWSSPYDSPWLRLPWIQWSLLATGVATCVSGYFILVHQLRAGIRPSSNENAFSPG